LFEQNVAREVAIPEPVAKAELVGGRPGLVDGDRRRSVVEGGDLRDLPDLSIVETANQFDERWRGANLEADGHADFAVGAAGNLEGVASLRDVDADGLFAVGVLARGGDGVEVLDVEEWRRGDLDGIDIGAGGNGL
jgi:hypothetical protein